MLTNIYTEKAQIITTVISAGRPQFPFRHPVRALGTYVRNTRYGENFYTLAGVVFQDERLHWALKDMNKPMDSMNVPVNTPLVMPGGIVRNERNLPKFF